jgi:hypothetical protein
MDTGRITRAIAIGAVLTAVLCPRAPGQDAQSKDAQSREGKGMPPRATPSDYQAHAEAGAFTVAAEFTGHSVSTPQAILSTEDYVAIEVAIYGPPEAQVKLSHEDFSLRINGKKTALAAQPYVLVLTSLKDPEWAPPAPTGSKGKTTFGGGGKGQGDDGAPPAPVHIPIEVERAMGQRVQKASLPEGDRTLPEAGLIFFQYRAKTDNLRSIELIYSGPAGKATLALHP